jgi:hypothetical protein
MTGAGAPRAAFDRSFRGFISIREYLARGVTDPDVGSGAWFGFFFIRLSTPRPRPTRDTRAGPPSKTVI